MKIKNFPNLRQAFYYDCGAGVLQSILAYYGINEWIDVLIKSLGITESGTSIYKIKKVAERYGLKTKLGKMTVAEVKDYIDRKIPVILGLQAWPEKKVSDWRNNWENSHFAIAIAYDKKKIYFEDPEVHFRVYLTYKELSERWHDMNEGKKCINYGLAIYGKEPKYNPEKVIHMD